MSRSGQSTSDAPAADRTRASGLPAARLPGAYGPDAPIVVRASAVGFSRDFRWRDRRSAWGELLWASRGAMSVTIADSLWLVPAREVLWIPPGVRHTVQFSGRGVLRSLNLQASLCVALSERPRVIAFGRLLRELVRRAIERDTLSLEQIADQPVIALLQVELAAHFAEPALPVDLPLPTDSRAMRAVSFILDDPGASPPIDILAQRSAASARTLARLFVRDTGMTVGAWRQRAALVHGLKAIADGSTVTQAALAAGYQSTSAFIAAVKRLTGRTPGQHHRPTR